MWSKSVISMSEATGWSFLRSRRWIGYFALLLLFSIACVFLGNWQFDRRAQARAEIARIDANYDAEAVPLEDELASPAAFDLDAQKWRTVIVTGEYLGEPLLVRNRPGESGAGSDVVGVLRADSGMVFFVDRGWVPVDASQGVDDSDVPASPTGRVTVEARLRASEPEIGGRSSSGRTVASLYLPEVARVAGVTGKAYVGAYGMLVSESPSAAHGVLPDRPERDEGPHLSYAVQWYVFIVIACIGVAYAANREYRTLNEDSERVADQDRRSAERKRRRGLSDAEEEDALLDG